MNQPSSELTQLPSGAKHAMSSVCEKYSRSWEQHEVESTTSTTVFLPPPGYRYPRRGAFTHSHLMRNAVIASIESSGSFDNDSNEIRKTSSSDGCNFQLFDLEQGNSPLKRSRSESEMEESIDMRSLSIRLPDLSTGSRRVSLRWPCSPAKNDSSSTSCQGL
jgi:hypothetical protein